MRDALERVLFVHAHPDDETLSTGGTIASLVDAGVAVTVVTCTRGEQGEVIPAELRYLEGRDPELAEHRTGELAAALRALGVTDHRFLGDAGARQPGKPPRRYVDSGMVWGLNGAKPLPSLAADSLAAAELGEVAADIATVIAELQPEAVVSYDETGGYGHPDHVRAHEATLRAAEVMSVPFFVIEPPGAEPQADSLHMDVSPVLARKIDAMRAHETQVSVDGETYALSSGPPLPIARIESFRRILPPPGDEHDEVGFRGQSIAGRVMTCIVSIILGLAVGFVGTVNHQATLSLFGASLPLGATAALVIFAAMLAGLRMVFDHRLPASITAVVTVAVLFLLSQEGPGGSVLVPANELGYAWTFGAPLIAAVVLAWPKLARGRAAKLESGPQQDSGPAPKGTSS